MQLVRHRSSSELIHELSLSSQLLFLVFGAVLGYCSGWLKAAVDERRIRRAVATALLAERSRLHDTIEFLVNGWRGGRAVAELASPMHDRFTTEVAHFDAITVARVLDYSGHLAELRKHLSFLNEIHSEEARLRFVQEVKGFAAQLQEKGELARESLVEAGGHSLQRAPLRLGRPSPTEGDA